MKLKLMPFFASVLTLAFVITPLAAQACNEGAKDQNASDSDFPAQTQSSISVEKTT